MAEKPPVRVCRVDHVEVAPGERIGWRSECGWWKHVGMGMAVTSVMLVFGVGDGKPDEIQQGKEHGGFTGE